jgi:hypothetical protein
MNKYGRLLYVNCKQCSPSELWKAKGRQILAWANINCEMIILRKPGKLMALFRDPRSEK